MSETPTVLNKDSVSEKRLPKYEQSLQTKMVSMVFMLLEYSDKFGKFLRHISSDSTQKH